MSVLTFTRVVTFMVLSDVDFPWLVNHWQCLFSRQATIWLALVFTFWQGYEYQTTWLDISDGNAGSTFFLATGFHGIHVLIGTIFLTISMVRQSYYHYSSMHLFGFEAASWYFHFVDVVWLFLFLTIYWWGNLAWIKPGQTDSEPNDEQYELHYSGSWACDCTK